MKKVVVILAMFVFSIANAQKGTVLVAGQIGFNSDQNSNGTKSNVFNISPKVGYQFSDNLTVGIQTGFGFTNRTELVDNGSQFVEADVKFNQYNLGAFLRYSKPLAGVFSAFADLTFGVNQAKGSLNFPGGSANETKYNGFFAGINPAIAIDLNKGLLLNFSVGGLNYNTIKADFNGAKASSAFSFNFGQQINIGISKNF
jgi:hypothetical protein